MLQPRTGEIENAPYSQQLGDFFTGDQSVLVKRQLRNYRPRWGCRLNRISPGKVCNYCLRLHRWPGRSQRRRFGVAEGAR